MAPAKRTDLAIPRGHQAAGSSARGSNSRVSKPASLRRPKTNELAKQYLQHIFAESTDGARLYNGPLGVRDADNDEAMPGNAAGQIHSEQTPEAKVQHEDAEINLGDTTQHTLQPSLDAAAHSMEELILADSESIDSDNEAPDYGAVDGAETEEEDRDEFVSPGMFPDDEYHLQYHALLLREQQLLRERLDREMLNSIDSADPHDLIPEAEELDEVVRAYRTGFRVGFEATMGSINHSRGL